jgi:ankyrin repeat protein
VRLNLNYVIGAPGRGILDDDLDAMREMGGSVQNSENGYYEVLTKAYHRNIQRIIRQDLDRHLRGCPQIVLGYVRDAYRPLSTEELRHAICTKTNKAVPKDDDLHSLEDIQSLCHGLIDWNDEDAVQFLHPTLRKYLSRPEGLVQIPRQDERLGESCMTYLLQTPELRGICINKDELKKRLFKHPFLNYCARYWHKHVSRFCEEMQSELNQVQQTAIFSATKEFLLSEPLVQAVWQVSMFPDPFLQKALRRRLKPSSLSLAAITVKLKPQQGPDPYERSFITGLRMICAYDLQLFFDDVVTDVKPKDLEARDQYQRTLLHYAAEVGNLFIVQRLLGRGAKHRLDSAARSPLQLAMSKKQSMVVDWLLGQEGWEDVILQTNARRLTQPLIDLSGPYEIIFSPTKDPDQPVTTGARYGVMGRSILHDAVEYGETKTFRHILTKFTSAVASMDSQGMTPLHKAAKKGLLDIVMVLVEANADVSHRIGVTSTNQPSSPVAGRYHHYRGTALHLACKYGHAQVVEYLVSKAPGLVDTANARGEYPLHMATLARTADVAQIVLAKCMEINVRDKDGMTALHYAVAYGTIDILNALLACDGIDVNVRDGKDETPLFVAVGRSDPKYFLALWDREEVMNANHNKADRSIFEYASKVANLPGKDWGWDIVVALLSSRC